MDKGISPVVLILAMLTGGGRADELVLQLNGEVASYPESMIITKIQRGVIDPNPVVNERGLRYFVQIARNNVDLYFPTLGWQTIIPHAQLRRRLIPNIQRSSSCNPCNPQKAAPSPLLSTPPPTPAPLREGPQWARANELRDLLHPSPAGSRVVHGVSRERSALPGGILPSSVQTRQLFLGVSGGVARPPPAVNEIGQSSAPYDGGRVAASSMLTRRVLQSQPQGPGRPTQNGDSGGLRSPVAHERHVTDINVMITPSATTPTTVTPPASKPSETQRVAKGQGSTQGRQRETLMPVSTATPVKQTTDKSVTASSAKSTRSQTTESTTKAATTIPNQPLKTETTTSHTSD